MAETGEAPVPQLTNERRRELRGLASSVVLGERGATAPALRDRDRRSIASAKEHMAAGAIDKSLSDLQETPGEIVESVRDRLSLFGYNRTRGGEKVRIVNPGSEDGRRYGRAETPLNNVEAFLSQGYDRLLPGQKTLVLNSVLNLFQRHSVLGAEFAQLTSDQQRAEVETLLKKDGYSRLLAERLKKIGELELLDESQIHNARKEHAGSEARTEVAGRTLTRNDDRAQATETRLTNLREGRLPPSPQQTAIGQAIDEATQSLEAAREAQEEANSQLQQAIEERNTLQQNGINIQNQQAYVVAQQEVREARIILNNAHQAVKTQERALNDVRRAQLTSIPNTDAREDQLEDRLEYQYARADEARIARAEAPEEVRANLATRRDLELQRRHQEERYARELENIFADTARSYINDELREAIRVLEEKEPENINDEVKDIRKATLRQMEDRFYRTITRRRGLFRRPITERVLDERLVIRTSDGLLRDGPEDGVRALLRTVRIRPDGVTTGRGNTLTPEQINELMNNEDFYNEIENIYIKDTLSERWCIQRPTPPEIHRLMYSSWGRDKIDDALAHNEQFRGQIQQLTNADNLDMDKPEFRNRLARELARRPGLLWSVFGTIPWLVVGTVRTMMQNNMARDERRYLARQITQSPQARAA